MATETSIEWTEHTFNPWWGCTKVHAGCTHCYAETFSHRYGFKVWGQNAERRTFGDKHWNEPVKWNKQAEAEGRRHRVFCASMADVFEDHPTLPDQRKRLFDLICRTPFLDWQVLTKRPENALRMMVAAGLYAVENPRLPCPQPNLWIGTSPCDQATADKYIPLLLLVPAAVRFLSCEPLIGPIDFKVQKFLSFPEPCYRAFRERHMDSSLKQRDDAYASEVIAKCPLYYDGCNCPGIDWVIVGGESGHGARFCGTDWLYSIIRQCRDAGVPCFVKQLGANPANLGGLKYHYFKTKDRKGGDWNEWEPELRVREMPQLVG